MVWNKSTLYKKSAGYRTYAQTGSEQRTAMGANGGGMDTAISLAVTAE